MRLFFLLVFIGLSGYSQKIDLGDIRGYKNAYLDTLNMEFILFFDDHSERIDLESFQKETRPLTIGPRIEKDESPLLATPVMVGNTIYFVHNSGGLVYALKNDSLKRIDHSFNHRMQYGAAIFTRGNTIFKYGGYGFWSVRDFFTYYDDVRKEWEVYQPINSTAIPRGTQSAYAILDRNFFHVFNGYIINTQNRKEKILNDEVWTFDFNKNKWEYKGIHEPISLGLKSVPYKNKLLLWDVNGVKEVIEIDIENNSRTLYQHSPITALVGISHISFFKHKFYMILHNATGSYFGVFDERDVLGDILRQEKFYKNTTHWVQLITAYAISVIVLILSFWFVKITIKKMNRIRLLDNGLRYRNKFVEFDRDSRNILKLLLAEEEVSSNKILKLVEKDQYSPAHNERIKVQKVKDINLKIAMLRGIREDVINSYKSPYDKRIRMYRISKEYF